MLKHLPMTLIVALVCAGGSHAQQPEVVPERLPAVGDVLGLASHVVGETTYVAAWYRVKSTNSDPSHSVLVIFDLSAGRYREVYVARESEIPSWVQLRALGGRLPGFVVETTVSMSDHDGDLVVALVDGRFSTVFIGETSEFVDLDADGLPEILESSWPDGDGCPKKTRVHVFDGKRYVGVGAVSWRERFGSRSVKLVSKTPAAKAQPN